MNFRISKTFVQTSAIILILKKVHKTFQLISDVRSQIGSFPKMERKWIVPSYVTSIHELVHPRTFINNRQINWRKAFTAEGFDFLSTLHHSLGEGPRTNTHLRPCDRNISEQGEKWNTDWVENTPYIDKLDWNEPTSLEIYRNCEHVKISKRESPDSEYSDWINTNPWYF